MVTKEKLQNLVDDWVFENRAFYYEIGDYAVREDDFCDLADFILDNL